MDTKRREVAGRVLLACTAAVLAFGWIRWWWIERDLNRPERIRAWEEILQSDGVVPADHRALYDFRARSTNPRVVKLWLEVGRDPSGHDCASWGRRPTAFALAILEPLGFCAPSDADEMPFIRAIGPYSPEATESIRLMIAAGADVNEAAPDGPMPLSSAALFHNEAVVAMLLAAGADPDLRPRKDYLERPRSALEKSAEGPASPVALRIREMLVEASAARDGRPEH